MSRLLLLRTFRPIASQPASLLSSAQRAAITFEARPGPPKLPPEQQAEIDKALEEAAARLEASAKDKTPEEVAASGALVQGAPPEFEGDVNPKTGEVGGPKNDPLRWGSKGDWTYRGRAVDF